MIIRAHGSFYTDGEAYPNLTVVCQKNSNAYKFFYQNREDYAKFNCDFISSMTNDKSMILSDEGTLYIFGNISTNESFIHQNKSYIKKVVIETFGEQLNMNDYYELFKSCSNVTSVEVSNATLTYNNVKYTGSIKCWDISDNKDKSILAILVNDETLILLTTAVDTTVAMPSAENLPNEINKNSIKKVVIGNGISTISAEMFEYFNNLNTVIIPQSMQSIYQGAFKNCSNLKAILIPSGVSLIGDSAFGGCTSLRDVVILSNQITLGSNISDGAFNGLDPAKITIYYKEYQSAYAKYNKKKITEAKMVQDAIFVLDSEKKNLNILGEGKAYLDHFSFSKYKDTLKTIEVGSNITDFVDVPHYLSYLKDLDAIYLHYGSSSVEGTLKNYLGETVASSKVEYIYTIKYYAKGNLVGTQEIKNGEKLKTISNINNYKPDGFDTFAGWTTSTSSANLEYANGAQVTKLTENINLYDIWSREARFHSGVDGQTLQKSKQYYNNKSGKYYLILVNPKSETGWENLGWRKDATATYAATPEGKSVTSTDQDYYYVYKKDVYFYSGIGKATVKSAKLYFNVKDGNYYLKTLANYNGNIAEINGWTIDGWTTDPDSRTKAQYGMDQTLNVSNTEFYAIYKRNSKIKVEYNGNEADSGSIDSIEAVQYYNTTGKVSGISTAYAKNVYEKDGYAFDYWTKDSGTQKFYPNDQLSFFPGVSSTQTTCTIKANWRQLNRYTLTYNGNIANVQNVPVPQVKDEGETIELRKQYPSCEGYEFLGWSYSATPNIQPAGSMPEFNLRYVSNWKYNKDENCTLYAIWAAKTTETYTVVYNANAGSNEKIENMPTQDVKQKDVALTLSTNKPTRTGYNFKGWAKSANSKTPDFTDANNTYTENKDIVLYAVWEAKTVTVTFMRNQSNGDTVSATQTFTYDVDDGKVKFSDKNWTREGYTQGQWYYNKECDSDNHHGINATVRNSFIARYADTGVTLYASWIENTARINYYGNGADTYKEKADVNGKSEKYKTVSINTTDWNVYDVVNLFGKNGYHIPSNEEAWKVGSADSNTFMDQTGAMDSAKNAIKERLKTETGFEVNLYANWQENELTIYYYPNGGNLKKTANGTDWEWQTSGEFEGSGKQVVKISKAEGKNLWDVGTLFTREGYHVTTAENAIAWIKDDVNSGEYINQNDSKENNQNHLEEIIANGNATMKLYANWQPNTVTLKFYPNGNDVTVTDEGKGNGKWNDEYCKQVINYNNTNASNYNMYNVLTLFTKKGYHIADNATAWKKDSADSNVYVNQATYDVKSLMKSGNVEVNLYANWIANAYTIKYDANGGEGTTASQTATYNSNVTLPSCGFTKAGYTFAGWTKEKNNGSSVKKAGDSVKNLTDSDNGEVTLYAYWTEYKPLRIYFNVNYGTLNPAEDNTRFSQKDSQGWILDCNNNNQKYCQSFASSKTDIDLPNTNNKKGFYIERTDYFADIDNEWFAVKDGTRYTFDHDSIYTYDDLITAAKAKEDCFELELFVNWVKISVKNIELKTEPNKTVYTKDENLDLKGGTIKITYNNNTTKDIDVTSAMVSGYDKTKVGEQTVTVTYEGKTTTFKVTVKEKVVEKTVTSIAIKTNPTKTIYEKGEDLNIAGAKITVTYSDKTTKEIDVTSAMVSGYDKTKVGEQTVTVTYEGKTTTFKVTVKEKQEELKITIKNHPYVQIKGITYIIVEKKTKVSTLLNDLELNSKDYNLVIKDGNKAVANTSNLKTGEKLEIENSTQNINVLVVVKGDINSDGLVDFNDVIELNNYRLNKAKVNLTDPEKIAFIVLKSSNIENITMPEIEFKKDIVTLNNYRLK